MVHQYQLNGYNIVLDTASGSVHATDEVAYDVSEMVGRHMDEADIVAEIVARHGVTEADVRECLTDVQTLVEEGKLFSEDPYEDVAFDFKKRPTVVKALCLHVAHTCNLNCS